MKTCTIDGCIREHRARGLCIAHYNERHRTRRKVEVPCTNCGALCEKYADDIKQGRKPFCDYTCRDLWALEQSGGDPLAAARAARKHQGPQSCPLPANHPVRWYGKAEPLDYRTCAWCGTQFCTGQYILRAYCTDRCKVKAKRMRRRGRENALSYGEWTWTDFMHVARRFGYRCAYCGDKPEGQLDPDHVVPLSKGGPNTVTNLLPACRPCNSDKRDLLLSEWAEDRSRRGLPARNTTWAADDSRFYHLTSVPLAA